MNAELYSLTHRGNPGDVAFYRGVCRGTKSVLELGSGSGRLLTALAGVKRRLVGLELDPELIALAKRSLRALPEAKRKSVHVLPADMREFTLTERFERVLLPYNALYCVLSKRAALACFRAAHRALEPGGVLALDVWNALPFARGPEHGGQDDLEPVVSFSHARRTWDVFESSRVRRAQQRLDVSYTYLPREGGNPVRIPIAQRYYLPAEVSELLERAGFAIEARYGNFFGARFGARSAQLVVLARAL